uniref:Uncharacterized protein n=1 Tax=Myoviridae sp. ctqYq4 TaxID=2826702 RepID=A0A8S5LVM7_9CAUD|nr:MAG TPA: hypothetical protein [Myoviridae sp. ctqYq4]
MWVQNSCILSIFSPPKVQVFGSCRSKWWRASRQ